MQKDQSWPAELDALNAAPANHRLLFENEYVRVLDTTIAPAQSTPLHTHRWPAALYILGWSDFIRRDEHGQAILDSRNVTPIPPGSALWTPPLPPHTLENIGTSELHVIAIELKRSTP